MTLVSPPSHEFHRPPGVEHFVSCPVDWGCRLIADETASETASQLSLKPIGSGSEVRSPSDMKGIPPQLIRWS